MVGMKTYKYYFIFKTDNDELFAYSDNKIYIKEFKKSRDMSKFRIIKEYITQDAVNDLAYNIPKKYLICKELLTKPHDTKISIIMTQYEYEGLIRESNDIFFNKIINKTCINPIIFKDDYCKALAGMGYNIYFRIWCGDLVLNDIFKFISPDYVNIFIYYFYGNE